MLLSSPYVDRPAHEKIILSSKKMQKGMLIGEKQEKKNLEVVIGHLSEESNSIYEFRGCVIFICFLQLMTK